MTVGAFMTVLDASSVTVEIKKGDALLAKVYGCGDVLDDTISENVVSKISMPKLNYVVVDVTV